MLNTIKRIILAVLLLQKTFYAGGQSETGKQEPVKYSPKQLQEDYDIFRKALETTYPSLYRFNDSLIMAHYLDDKFKLLNQPWPGMEFYKLIATTCAKIQDEHLIPMPPKDYYQSLKNAHHYFPFSLKIIDRRFYVLTTANDTLPAGSEILSINGRSVEDILNTLLPTIPSDGYMQTFDIRHLEDYSMTEEDNLFDLNYPIFIQDTSAFRIEYLGRNEPAVKKVATVAGLGFKSYKNFFYSRNKLVAPLEFKYLKKDIAYLRISSFLGWHRNRFKQDFYKLYDSVFKQLKSNHTQNLVLDLRNNEGGDGTGEKLLTYLLTKPYKLYTSAELKFVGYPPVVDYLENDRQDVFFADSLVDRVNTGLYKYKEQYMPLPGGEQQPDSNHYNGKLYVLINGASGSMASVVASILKGNGRGVFIGEESGGAMEGATAFYGANLILPNSKIGVHMGLLKTIRAVAFTKGRGVYPDYYISPKIDDILKGTDTELNFTLSLIPLQK